MFLIISVAQTTAIPLNVLSTRKSNNPTNKWGRIFNDIILCETDIADMDYWGSIIMFCLSQRLINFTGEIVLGLCAYVYGLTYW